MGFERPSETVTRPHSALSAGSRRPGWSSPDALQFAALRAFDARWPPARVSPSSDPQTRRELRAVSGGGEQPSAGTSAIVAIDEVMRDVGAAEDELARRVEADLLAVGDRQVPSEMPITRLERIESWVSGRTDAERRLMALLAYHRADCGVDAERSAQLALGALRDGDLFDDGLASPAVLAAGLALGLAGRTREAEALFGRILPRARLARADAAFAVASAQRGVERYRQGALRDAIPDLRAALDTARGKPWETIVDDGRAVLVRAYADTGRAELAEQELCSWCATGPLPETAFGTRLLIERGRLRLAQGRFDAALSDFESVRSRLAGRARSMVFEWRSPAAITHHRLGHHAAALELAQSDLSSAAAWGAPRQLAIALRTLGQIEGGDEGIQKILEALALLESTPARLERARTLVTLGTLLRRAGEPARAQEQLRAAGALARECGASPLAERAEEEIAVCGGTRRRGRDLSGPDALTAGEHRVARLAASGMSNPEIARFLFVTRKTVEMHLGHAYQKLEISSRAELPAALTSSQAV